MIDLIEQYKSALAVVNTERAELSRIMHIAIPEANQQNQVARGNYDSACLRMKSCIDMQEMNTLKGEAVNSKDALDMSNQLITNLKNRANQIRANESNARSQLKSALQNLWLAKSDQIIETINIPEETVLLLEQAITARNLASLGNASLMMSDHLKDKMGKITLERLNTVAQQLMQELGVEPPTIALY